MADLAHQQIFQARLKRISAGGKNTMSQVYVGDSGVADRRDFVKAGKGQGRMSSKAKSLNAFLIGAISMAIARLMLFHFVSDNGAYSEQSLGPVGVLLAVTLGDFAFAGIIALVALWLKKLRGQKYLFLALAGFGMIMLGETRLLQASPEIYSALYSPSYTQMQLADLK